MNINGLSVYPAEMRARHCSIRAGDVVTIRPEWRDAGDVNYQWKAIEDEDGGRVRIQPQIPGLTILPTQVVDVAMLEKGLR